MKKINKGKPDKRIKRWQRLQRKNAQQREREIQLDSLFYRLYKSSYKQEGWTMAESEKKRVTIRLCKESDYHGRE